jgi:hypothetical protein
MLNIIAALMQNIPGSATCQMASHHQHAVARVVFSSCSSNNFPTCVKQLLHNVLSQEASTPNYQCCAPASAGWRSHCCRRSADLLQATDAGIRAGQLYDTRLLQDKKKLQYHLV